MNKLTALSKLASAYHYVVGNYPAGSEGRGAQHILEDNFGYIRRSLRLADLAPAPKNAEGLNPAGPKYF